MMATPEMQILDGGDATIPLPLPQAARRWGGVPVLSNDECSVGVAFPEDNCVVTLSMKGGPSPSGRSPCMSGRDQRDLLFWGGREPSVLRFNVRKQWEKSFMLPGTWALNASDAPWRTLAYAGLHWRVLACTGVPEEEE